MEKNALSHGHSKLGLCHILTKNRKQWNSQTYIYTHTHTQYIYIYHRHLYVQVVVFLRNPSTDHFKIRRYSKSHTLIYH